MPCPQVEAVGFDVLAGVDHTLVDVELIGGLYTLTVLTVAFIALITRNDTRRKTGEQALGLRRDGFVIDLDSSRGPSGRAPACAT